jgi:hypothetical protein
VAVAAHARAAAAVGVVAAAVARRAPK